MDAHDSSCIEKFGYMFSRPDPFIKRTLEVVQFQHEATLKYITHLEGELKEYKKSVADLVGANPQLGKFFCGKIRNFKFPAKSVNPEPRRKN